MINKEKFEKADYGEKMRFIKKILSLATHNALTKDDLLLLLKWQFEQNEQLKDLLEKYREAVRKCLTITFMGAGCGVHSMAQYSFLVDKYLTEVEGLAFWKN